MKSRLVREIEKTIRALEEFAIDWEKHFPENAGTAFRIRARAPRRRFAQILKMPPQLVAAKEMNHANHDLGDWGKRQECNKQTVNK